MARFGDAAADLDVGADAQAQARADDGEGPGDWRLEVTRGRDVGRVYRVPPGLLEIVLGAGVDAATGIDLRDQETSPTRRMAARQAALVRTGAGLAVRDLASPGGTFVNRQRLLTDQPRALRPGDVLQLAAVQLRVVRTPIAAPSAPAAPSTLVAPSPSPSSASASTSAELSVPFVLAGGQTCRCWDDFLTVSAQRWDELRSELVSGRLAEHLRRANRADLVPGSSEGRALSDDDERLDDWLARIPSARSSGPELDVHPEELELSAASVSGTVRQIVRVANVGYRRLRWTARAEPAGAKWLRPAPEHDGRWCFTIESADLPILLDVPERLDRPLSAAIVLESNGGTRRIAVRIVPSSRRALDEGDGGPGMGGAGPTSTWGRASWASGLSSHVRAVRPAVRVGALALAAFGVRALMMIGSDGPANAAATAPATASAGPSLSPLALVLAASGALLALAIGRGAGGRREPDGPRGRDAGPAAFAGACLGLLAAAVAHAVVLSIETLLRGAGGGPVAPWTALPLWAAFGAVLGALSCWLLPYRPGAPEADS